MNTNSYNIWIQQPLLAADVIEAEHCPWDYQSFLSHKGDELKATFHPVPTPEVQEEIISPVVNNTDKSDQSSKSEEQGESPKFEP